MELLYTKTYQEYKTELDGEFHKATESFVKIGYLLRLAKDTDILGESGYKDYQEFARAEYGLESSQVSRFININKRFSEGGYSDHLLPEYQGFGSSKLAIMLNLPEEIVEDLTPAYSKSDLQAIKDEIDEENKLSEIEVYLEEREKMPESKADERMQLLNETLYVLFRTDPDLYAEICDCMDAGRDKKAIRETLAPTGDKTYSVRISGKGRAMLMVNENRVTYKITLLRTSEKYEYTAEDMERGFEYCKITDTEKPAESRWESLYGECYPVAPVQEDKPKWGESAKTVENTKSDKAKKVVKARVSKTEKEEEKVEAEDEGQDMVPQAEDEPDKDNETDTEAGTNEGEGAPENDIKKPGRDAESDVRHGEAEESKDDGGSNHETDGCVPNEDVAGEGLVQGGLEKNVVRGYKAAVTNNLNTLRRLWEGDNPNKIKRMLDVVEDLEWRLKQIQKGV